MGGAGGSTSDEPHDVPHIDSEGACDCLCEECTNEDDGTWCICPECSGACLMHASIQEQP